MREKSAFDLRDRSKNIFTFVKNRSKNDICYLYFEIFFSKKIFCLELSNSKINDFFFRFAKIFQFFVVAPHQQIFEIFETVEFLNDHVELDIGNFEIGTVIFIVMERSMRYPQ